MCNLQILNMRTEDDTCTDTCLMMKCRFTEIIVFIQFLKKRHGTYICCSCPAHSCVGQLRPTSARGVFAYWVVCIYFCIWQCVIYFSMRSVQYRISDTLPYVGVISVSHHATFVMFFFLLFSMFQF